MLLDGGDREQRDGGLPIEVVEVCCLEVLPVFKHAGVSAVIGIIRDWRRRRLRYQAVVWAAGRAVRFPYGDNRLARFVNNLPLEVKYQPGARKYLLQAYLRRHLPDHLVDRPKRSFIFDLNIFLREDDFRWIHQLQTDGRLQVLPGWSAEALDKLLTRFMADPVRTPHRLYALGLLATWHASLSEGQAVAVGAAAAG